MHIVSYEHPGMSAIWPEGIEMGKPHILFTSWGDIHIWQSGHRIRVQKQTKPFSEYTIQELRDLVATAFIKTA